MYNNLLNVHNFQKKCISLGVVWDDFQQNTHHSQGGKSNEISVPNLRSNACTLESPWSPAIWCCFHKQLQKCFSTFHRQGKIVPLNSWLKPKKSCRAEENPPRLQETWNPISTLVRKPAREREQWHICVLATPSPIPLFILIRPF